MKQESATLQELIALNKRCMKNMRTNTQTNISEEYEYSHEKAERVSIPYKNSRN